MLFSLGAINHFLQPPSPDSNPPPSTSPLGPLSSASQDATVNLLSELQGDRQRRQKAIWKLGLEGDSRAIRPLVQLLLDSDSKQRSLILAALSEIGAKTLGPLYQAFAVCLQDENPEVRKNAMRDLSRVFDLSQQMGQIVNHVLHDPDLEVQEAAQWAAKRLQESRMLQPPLPAPATLGSPMPEPVRMPPEPARASLKAAPAPARSLRPVRESPLERAKQGDPKAIASLMNQAWQPQGITARVSCREGCLEVWLEAEPVPKEQILLPVVRRGLALLGLNGIQTVKVAGLLPGALMPTWIQALDLAAEAAPATALLRWG